MGSTSSTSSSLSSLITPLTLSGVSTYSSDFQSILNRQVQIAELPLQELQTQDSTVLSQAQTLGGFIRPVNDLANAITALGNLASNQALAATSSDSTKVTAQATGATSPASYTISNITFIAGTASESSVSGYADSTTAQVSSTGILKLVVGSNSYTINLTPQTNNLSGLENAINNLNAGVTASILTTGTGSNPNYLSISANATGATTLQLFDDPTGADKNLLTDNNQGSDAVFHLNGVPVTNSSNTINNVIPGLTFTIVAPTSPNQNVTLSLSSDGTQLASAVQTFVSAYNALNQQVLGQEGPAAGPLAGDFLVRQMQQDLQSLTTYSGNASIKSLSDLGISIDSAGKMSVDPTVISSFSSSQLSDAFNFFGSATTGFGALAGQFNELTDPVSGLITIQDQSYTSNDQHLQGQISTLTTQIQTMQATLSQQLAAADALVAELQSQQTVISASVQSVNLALYGRNNVSY